MQVKHLAQVQEVLVWLVPLGGVDKKEVSVLGLEGQPKFLRRGGTGLEAYSSQPFEWLRGNLCSIKN